MSSPHFFDPFDLQQSTMATDPSEKNLHVAMYPWFAMGHLTSFLHLANKLAERGHRISFFIPTKTISKLESFNRHPNLIQFIPVTVPHVDGLPEGAETTADVPYPLHQLIMTALDLTKPTIETSLQTLKPQIVFFDFTHWLPEITRRLNMKAVHYCTISPASVGFLVSPERNLLERKLTEAAMMEPPPSFPPSCIKLRKHEAKGLVAMTVKDYGKDITFIERNLLAFTECDVLAFKTSREMEGPYLDYVENQFKKPVFLAGPVVPEAPTASLDPNLAKWLDKFEAKTLIYCAFGSECILKKDQLQELALGFELTGLPFFCALKPPMGCDTTESALPEGFEERVKGKGIVQGGWVQQQLILKHPSVGCFVTHCGSGSLSEALVTECQLVLLPNVGDQVINARMMGGDLKVGVEVEKGEEDGLFTKHGVCKAVKAVMDRDSEVGKDVRTNHGKWRNLLLQEGLESSYVDSFVKNLKGLLMQ